MNLPIVSGEPIINYLCLMNLLNQTWFLLKKEILLEWRSKYAFNGVLLYVVSTVFVCYISFSLTPGFSGSRSSSTMISVPPRSPFTTRSDDPLVPPAPGIRPSLPASPVVERTVSSAHGALHACCQNDWPRSSPMELVASTRISNRSSTRSWPDADHKLPCTG